MPATSRISAESRPREEDAYPADPEAGYGWEKLFTEQLCRYYWHDFKLETRIVRFHNIYGPLGTYDGGKEKAPAAICRKVALAKNGDRDRSLGRRPADPLVHVHRRLRRGHAPADGLRLRDPLNLGTDQLVIGRRAGEHDRRHRRQELSKRHDLSKPQGVRGRNSDNTLLRRVLGWEPAIRLEQGLAVTYRWIEGELAKEGRIPARATAAAQ